MKRSLASILVIVACLMTGCAARVQDPATEGIVRKYEDWLKASGPPRRRVGTAKLPEDVVFDTDLRAAPDRGMSKVHIRNTPPHTYYVYQDQINRLIDAAFFDGLAAVMVPVGRWGYIDESGRFAIPPIFRGANDFDHGIATAEVGPDAPDRTPVPDRGWVLLDKSGSIKALDPAIVSVEGFSAGFAAFSTGGRKSGYLDRTGAITIPATFAAVRPFCADGTAAVRAGNSWGLIDAHGGFIVQPQYEDIHCFSEGLAAVKNGKWGFIDKSGHFVIPPRLNGAGDFSEGLASFESRTWPNGPKFPYVSTYGFIDETGSVVIRPQYVAVYPFKFGIAKTGTTRINWIVYPMSFLVPADPHYTAWQYIDRHGKLAGY